MVTADAKLDYADVFRGVSPARRALRRFFRHRAGLLGGILVVLVTTAALIAPWVVPFPEDALGTSHMEERLLAPSRRHWFGTDQLGRDVFSRVVFGSRISLVIGVLSVLSSAAIGTLCGLVSGYAGGWVDELLMRLADVFLGVPPLLLAMLVAVTFGGGIEITVLAIAVTWWTRYARLIRGEVLRIKVQPYVMAARSYGASHLRVLTRHILPGTLSVLMVQASLQMGAAILVAAALGFIGLGTRPPSPEWGLNVANGREYLPDAWWLSLFPGMAIMITVVALNTLGDGLTVALDARAETGL